MPLLVGFEAHPADLPLLGLVVGWLREAAYIVQVPRPNLAPAGELVPQAATQLLRW